MSLSDRLIASGGELEYSSIKEERFDNADIKLMQEIGRSAEWLEKALSQAEK